jgi:hypothetical protein
VPGGGLASVAPKVELGLGVLWDFWSTTIEEVMGAAVWRDSGGATSTAGDRWGRRGGAVGREERGEKPPNRCPWWAGMPEEDVTRRKTHPVVR